MLTGYDSVDQAYFPNHFARRVRSQDLDVRRRFASVEVPIDNRLVDFDDSSWLVSNGHSRRLAVLDVNDHASTTLSKVTKCSAMLSKIVGDYSVIFARV